MRIIAGAHKGAKLTSPSGANTRPTSDRVKESLFSMLDGYGVLPAANVLDLFAGSGGLGFEAMSRGAAQVDFVDSSLAATRALESNADKLGSHTTKRSLSPRAMVVSHTATATSSTRPSTETSSSGMKSIGEITYTTSASMVNSLPPPSSG